MNTLKTLFFFGLMALVDADDLYVLQEVDFEALASNDVEFKKYKDCVLNKAPCNELYGSYKGYIPESALQACKKCTTIQKHFAYQLFDTFKTKYPEDYVLFKQIYDPENKHLEALEMELIKYKTV